ncbi:spore wall protein 2 isoform X2 [Balamuthia mandrillaris]
MAPQYLCPPCGATGTYMWGFYNGLISCDCLTGLACADVPGTGDGYDGTADGYDGTGDGNDGTGDGNDGTGDGNDGNEDSDGGDPKGDGANPNHITPFAFNNLF